MPWWLSRLERQSHNLKVVSSTLTRGMHYFFASPQHPLTILGNIKKMKIVKKSINNKKKP